MPQARPKVLLLTPSAPFPPTNGGMLRIVSLVEALKDDFDFSLLTFAYAEGEKKFTDAAKLIALEGLFKEVHSVPKETITDDPKCCPPLPRIAREWFSPAMAAAVMKLSPAYDILHVEFLNIAFYVRYSRARVSFLTEHDLGHLSLFNSYFREWTGLRRFAEIPEWLKVRSYHSAVCAEYSRVVTLTEFDRDLLAARIPAGRLHLVKTGTSLARFPFREPRREHLAAPLIYVGHYPHYPNEDAALWFCRDIFPLVLKKDPAVRLVLAGSQPAPSIEALAAPGAPVTVTGEVPDINACLSAAGVFVAPLRLGFGIKGKVLEAFSAGIPVVATSLVARGLAEAVPGRHLLVADSPAAFAAAVLRLRTDFALYRDLALAARQLVEKHYSWANLSKELARAYTSALPTGEAG
ncbi:MAG: glycosyltransferase family 4 protein [Elusimicrobiales bacterium]|nr:glycosyltransferase family 4 protein [Elusimicrobiales bacterium]